jgi:hypothetical protein
MKPTNERFQAATQVNVVSLEICVTKGDSVKTLEASIVSYANASRLQLCRGHRQWHGIAWSVSEPGRSYHISSAPGYWRTSRKHEEAEMYGRKSDKLIVVMKQGNACGAKGLALLRRDLGTHCPGADLEK